MEINKNRKFTNTDRKPLVKKANLTDKTNIIGKIHTIVNAIKTNLLS